METKQERDNRIVDAFIRYGLLILLIAGSIYILLPFLITLIWGIIIAVALFRWYRWAVKKLNGKKNLTAALFTIVLLSIIILPSILVASSTVQGYRYLIEAFRAGNLTIPPPTNEVAEWPVIGETLFRAWDLASHNLKEFINTYSEQVGSVGSWALNFFTSVGSGILQFMISILVAGFLLSRWAAGQETTKKFAKRLVGDRAEDFIKLTAGTIRSVVQGIVGVSIIQAVASAVLMFAFGIPLAGIWSTAILVITILQLPALLVFGPMIIYAFSIYDTFPAVVFTVLSIIIGLSDSILKSMFMGKGTGIPTLIILLGAIGGMIVAGILGLFVGAVVLALSYKLLIAWLNAEAQGHANDVLNSPQQ